LKVKIIFVNRTASGWVKEGLNDYVKRLKRYLGVDYFEVEISSISKKNVQVILEEEAVKVMAFVKPGDHVILLDEQGLKLSSEGFSVWLNKKFVSIQGDLIFVIGGAYGFHKSLKERASEKLSLSDMTFTHQMVRVIFVEQLYRAMTILKNEPYHHS